jgi:PIN domain nuclease of toxin-antitoxin system
MKLLLDTHAFVWAAVEPERLSPRVRRLLTDRRNDVLLSAASGYEIEFKRHRDAVLASMPLDLDGAVQAMEFQWLAITVAHAGAAGRLARLHGDPFDRILVAQALEERAALVTMDARLPAYGATIVW